MTDIKTDKIVLPKRCPHCGREFMGGYGRVQIAVRGFWPQSQRPIGIYDHEDEDIILCRICFSLYNAAFELVRDANMHYLSAGIDEGRRWEKEVKTT